MNIPYVDYNGGMDKSLLKLGYGWQIISQTKNMDVMYCICLLQTIDAWMIV